MQSLELCSRLWRQRGPNQYMTFDTASPTRRRKLPGLRDVPHSLRRYTRFFILSLQALIELLNLNLPH